MKYLIADIVVEFEPKYDELKHFAKQFEYLGGRQVDIRLSVSDATLEKRFPQMVSGTIGDLESFLLSSQFNRAAVKFNTMLVHSSALVYNGGAYLFSARSGVGKSTHTKLWLKAFGDKVHILNDDKPVVRMYDDKAVVYGTPFDGASGIALNESAPLKAIVFVERGEENSVRIPSATEVLQKLYFQTARKLNREAAADMLANFEKLLGLTKFYVLTCNMDISAAYTAFDAITEK